MRSVMRRIPGAFLLAFLLAGCAAFHLIEPRRVAVGDLYTVEPGIAWSARRTGKIELWTVDGPALQALRFVSGIADGEALFEERRGRKQPKFRKGMTPTEILEFVVDSMSSAGAEKVTAAGLRPVPFGKASGFRFELVFLWGGGLEGEGVVVGTVINDKLYVIIYSGTRAHYYAKHREDVEQILSSIVMQ